MYRLNESKHRLILRPYKLYKNEFEYEGYLIW